MMLELHATDKTARRTFNSWIIIFQEYVLGESDSQGRLANASSYTRDDLDDSTRIERWFAADLQERLH